MSLKNRSVTIIEDLSNEEIEQVFCVADRMLESIKGQTELCAGQIMATLFYEPSTRTRLSFEAAMNRLGGRVISVSDAQTSSHAKGESLADTARVVGSYVDIMVIRHPSEGSPRIAADYAGVPVVNAGDGTHEHPTQTLCDLYTLRREKGHIKGLTVALWGDLKYGRTVHSLAYGLARFGARIVALADEGMELPEYVTARLLNEYSCHVIQGKASDLDRIVQQVDAVCLNPPSSKQLPLTAQYSGDESGHKDDRDSATGQIDVLYLTRLQKERQFSSEGAAKVRYKTIDHQFMKRAEFSDTLLMHPLPRVGELSCELDTDPRSIYFKQASFGVPIRMALVSLLLGVAPDNVTGATEPSSQHRASPTYKRCAEARCINPNCVSVHEPLHAIPQFIVVSSWPLKLRCIYCDREYQPPYVANNTSGRSSSDMKRYHSSDSSILEQVRLEDLIFFNSELEAQALGFRPAV